MAQSLHRRLPSRPISFHPRLEFLELRLAPATYTVTNTFDDGPGSLRQAIVDGNGNPGLDTIDFAIGSGVQTIAPNSVLPKITSPVIIDGTTQPGEGTTPRIVLSGANVGNNSGLWITAGRSTIKGLVINGFQAAGIILQTNGNNVIQGNYIGTDPTGTFAVPNGSSGVLSSLVSNTTIGGTAPGAGNVISGNYDAVNLFKGSGHIVQGNYLGTNAAGTAIIGNDSGVDVFDGTNVLVGGTVAGARNVISGNRNGIVLANNTHGVQVQGNLIGTDVSGSVALGNTQDGILFTGSTALPTTNTIGGTTPEARNIISGNGWSGVTIFAGTNNDVQGNFIGTDITGTAKLGNEIRGVRMLSNASFNNMVGGTEAGAGNLISGNSGYGVEISSNDRVQGNYIGTNALGTAALGNGLDGVYVHGLIAVTIGGTEARAGNVISGNARAGVRIGGTTGDHVVQGNYIGTDVTGTAAIPNRLGVYLTQAAQRNTIGGTSAGARNIISGNTRAGILISDITTIDNDVQGNYIGTDVTGTLPLSNSIGIRIYRSSRLNTVGGTTAQEGNLISGNHTAGISISSVGSGGNVVFGNRIGIDATGAQPLPNGIGVSIDLAPGNTIGGTAAGASNVIAFNSGDGVRVDTGTGNAIRANAIYVNGGLGIALVMNGNNSQPAPVITSVVSTGDRVTIRGTLTAEPNVTYTLDFFANAVCDPSGFGEGEKYLGNAAATTDGSGVATFRATFSGSVSSGQFITATATSPEHDTSGFSACTGAPIPPPSDRSGHLPRVDLFSREARSAPAAASSAELRAVIGYGPSAPDASPPDDVPVRIDLRAQGVQFLFRGWLGRFEWLADADLESGGLADPVESDSGM